jgi:hypothetical protein
MSLLLEAFDKSVRVTRVAEDRASRSLDRASDDA